LRLVQANPADGSVRFERIQSDFALNGARQNISEILAALEETAPDADIYVMGYYFAYPHARDSQKEGVAEQLEMLNRILENEAGKAGANFVPVDGAFGQEAKSKVPNPGDVHPSFEGYQAMANQFLKEYRPGWVIEDWELPQPDPISFEEILNGQQAAEAPETDGDAESAETPEEEAAESDGESSAMRLPDLKSDYLALRTALPIL